MAAGRGANFFASGVPGADGARGEDQVHAARGEVKVKAHAEGFDGEVKVHAEGFVVDDALEHALEDLAKVVAAGALEAVDIGLARFFLECAACREGRRAGDELGYLYTKTAREI